MKKVYMMVVLIGILPLVGCVENGYEKFYTPLPQHATSNNLQLELCATPHVKALPEGVSDYDLNTMMFVEGYALIGSAEWNGPSMSDQHAEAVKQGQQVGACLVLLSKKHTGEKHGATPHTTYTPGTTSTVTTLNGGYATVYTPGTTSTEYIPYSVSRYDYVGLFYAKLKDMPHLLGIAKDTPPTWYMQKTDSRKRILIVGVRKNSPAYKANMFRGDIIAKINGIAYSADENLPFIDGENEIEIYRNGETVLKKVLLQKR